ncbi:MAG: 5'-nucleotidase [Bacteroidota bacterium]
MVALFSCSSPVDYQASYTWSPVEINPEIAGSDEMEAIIAPYRERLDSIMDEVIGYAAHDLTSRGQYESNLGTFITRLTLEQSIASYDTHVDVAIMNHHGGLRAPINEGPIRLGEVFAVMPFENEVLLLEISGEDLIKVIEYIGKSGRSMIWPVSFDVDQSRAKNIKVDGKAVVAKQNYVIAISDYLANGGSGFQMLRPLKRMDLQPIKLRDMIVQEIRDHTAKGDSIWQEVSHFITVSNP